MQRVVSFAVVAVLMAFLSLPVAGMGLWMAVFIFGYTPPFWLALALFIGVVLNFVVMVGRRLHPSYRPRSS